MNDQLLQLYLDKKSSVYLPDIRSVDVAFDIIAHITIIVVSENNLSIGVADAPTISASFIELPANHIKLFCNSIQ